VKWRADGRLISCVMVRVDSHMHIHRWFDLCRFLEAAPLDLRDVDSRQQHAAGFIGVCR
jgi:hypothetical protein